MAILLLVLIVFLLVRESSLFKLPFAVPNSNISTECRNQLTQYVDDWREGKEWTLKMFDTPGEISKAIVDLGNFDECLNVNEVGGNYTVTGKYCIGRYKPSTSEITTLPELNQSFANAALGICVPSKCSSSEIEHLYNDEGIHMSVGASTCQTKETAPSLNALAIVTITFIALLVITVAATTIYDIHAEKNVNSFCKAFSLRTNGRYLFHITTGDQIKCLYGIRVVSMMWIVLHHTLSERRGYIEDRFGQKINEDTPIHTFASSGPIAVDTFLLMTGLLISVNELKAISQERKFNILRHYVSRYIRLTPVLMMLVLIYTSLGPLLGSGPLWYNVVLCNRCKSYWWSAMLHIQNYVNPSNPCIGGSWYISLDMQLFIFSPILLVPLKTKPKLVMLLTIVLAACSTALAFISSYLFVIHDSRTYTKYYYKPIHTRAVSWLIGIITGYLIFRAKRIPPKLNKVISSFLWIASVIILPVCVYIGPNILDFSDEYRLANALRTAFVRPLWCMAIAWIIHSCYLNPANIINKFLSLPIFEVLSKLTFTTYLVHTNMIKLIIVSSSTITQFTTTELVLQYACFLIAALLAGLILTLSLEIPIISMEKSFRKKSR